MAGFLSKLTFLGKSLFYQGNFNTGNMQGTGFAWLVRPEIEKRNLKLKPEDEDKLNGYFNTNPSFVTLVSGIYLNELKRGANPGGAKNLYGAAFAALGDSFFWHGLKPLLFLLTLIVCLFVSIWGVLIYPLAYAAFHLFFLAVGFKVGEHLGSATIMVFNRIHFNYWADLADKASIFLLGMLTAQLFRMSPADGQFFLWIAAALFIAGFALYKYVRPVIFMCFLLALIMATLYFYGGFSI